MVERDMLEAARSTIDRPALVAQIARETFTVIYGPAGLGKRALLRTWRRSERGQRADLITITADRADVSASRRDLATRLRAALWPSSPGAVAAGAVDDEVREIVMLELFTRDHPVLMLSDPLMTTDERVLDDLLGLTMRVPHLRVILVAPARVPTFERLGREASCVLLGGDDLGFSPNEVRTLAANVGLSPSQGDVERLVTAFGGWPAPIAACVSRASDARVDWDDAVAATAAQYVQPVLEAPSASFAIALAIWGQVDRRDLSVLDDDATRFADELVERGMCVARRGAGGATVLELRPAVRDALRTNPRAPRVTSRLITRALERERPDLALRAAVDGEQWSIAVSLIERYVAALIKDAEPGTLAALRRLPVEVAAGSPRAFAMLEFIGGPASVPEHMLPSLPASNQRLAELALEPHADSLLGDLQLAIALMRLRGDRDREATFTKAMTAIASNVEAAASTRLAAAVKRSWMVVAFMLLLDERYAESLSYLRLIAVELNEDGEAGEIARAAQWLVAIVCVMSGDLDAGRRARDLAQAADVPGGRGWSRGLAPVAEGALAYQEGRWTDAAEAMRRAPRRWYDLYSTGVVLFVQARIAEELPVGWGLDRTLLRTSARLGYRSGAGTQLPVVLSAAMLERAAQRGEINRARAVWAQSQHGARNALAMAKAERAGGSPERAREVLQSLSASALPSEAIREELGELQAQLDVEAPVAQRSWDEALRRLDAAEHADVDRLGSLSTTERQVLADVDGRTVSEVAQLRFVSRNTVKSQLRSVYRKLGVSTKEEALRVMRAAHVRKR